MLKLITTKLITSVSIGVITLSVITYVVIANKPDVAVTPVKTSIVTETQVIQPAAEKIVSSLTKISAVATADLTQNTQTVASNEVVVAEVKVVTTEATTTSVKQIAVKTSDDASETKLANKTVAAVINSSLKVNQPVAPPVKANVNAKIISEVIQPVALENNQPKVDSSVTTEVNHTKKVSFAAAIKPQTVDSNVIKQQETTVATPAVQQQASTNSSSLPAASQSVSTKAPQSAAAPTPVEAAVIAQPAAASDEGAICGDECQ